jgi:hypothetical protein
MVLVPRSGCARIESRGIKQKMNRVSYTVNYKDHVNNFTAVAGDAGKQKRNNIHG